MPDIRIPELPPARGPGQDGGTATIAPRYEDIAQDGRIQLAALTAGIGPAIFHSLLSKLPVVSTLRDQGILPILHRMVLVGEDRSCSANVPIRYEGSFRLARQKDGDRLFANMWLEARAPIASTLGERPPKDAPYELLGRVFSEHVLTRLFAPPAERRVTRLDVPGVPPIPEDEHVFEDAGALIASAGGPLAPAGEVVFAFMHTDSNQHVNSLVYPRVFEEMAARKMMHDARIAAPQTLLARAIELRWRKPFFAGERARVQLREVAERGVIGAFYGDGEKPSTAIAMRFR